MTDFPNEQAVADALQLVLEAHQRYLNDEPGGVRLNLRGANMAGADMTAANMAGADMIAADMAAACMTLASMAGANMIRANMADALMIGVDMTGARMRGACMKGADLRGTPFQQQAASPICPAFTPSTHDPS